MQHLEKSIRESLSNMTDDQISKTPSRSLDLICEAIKVNDMLRAGILSWWYRLGMREAEKRNLPI